MSRRKTRAQDLARRWRKKKHLRQKLAAIRNRARKAELAILAMDRPPAFSNVTNRMLEKFSGYLFPPLTASRKSEMV